MLTLEQLTRLKEVCKTASNNASSLYEVNEAESALADIDAEILYEVNEAESALDDIDADIELLKGMK